MSVIGFLQKIHCLSLIKISAFTLLENFAIVFLFFVLTVFILVCFTFFSDFKYWQALQREIKIFS
jgi:hypothetical protein